MLFDGIAERAEDDPLFREDVFVGRGNGNAVEYGIDRYAGELFLSNKWGNSGKANVLWMSRPN